MFLFYIILFSGLNGKIQYSITSGDDGHEFRIADNGTIYTAKPLDRENIPIYNLVVTAKDMAKPPEPQLSSTVQVTSCLLYLGCVYTTKSNTKVGDTARQVARHYKSINIGGSQRQCLVFCDLSV